MTTQVITISPHWFIDLEGAYIPYTEEISQQKQEPIKRNSTPFSEMKSGKFRKLFNRHTIAYR